MSGKPEKRQDIELDLFAAVNDRVDPEIMVASKLLAVQLSVQLAFQPSVQLAFQPSVQKPALRSRRRTSR